MAEAAIYGLMAEFTTPREVLSAARRAHAEGYRRMDAYTPQPVEGLAEAIGFHKTRLPALVFAGGLVGCGGALFMEEWASAIGYPLNIGGRPYSSWPAFIPITFELTVLFAALTAVIGMIALNGLPLPYHPVFNAPEFARASRDRYFLCIQADDPRFDAQRTREFLGTLEPLSLSEVPA